MSEYWSATSGTALVFQKEEVRDFFTRYLLETYRKDGVTDRDIDFIDCTISEYGSDSFYFLRSAYRQSLLEDFHSPNLKGSADPLGSVLLSLIFNILFNRCL